MREKMSNLDVIQGCNVYWFSSNPNHIWENHSFIVLEGDQFSIYISRNNRTRINFTEIIRSHNSRTTGMNLWPQFFLGGGQVEPCLCFDLLILHKLHFLKNDFELKL